LTTNQVTGPWASGSYGTSGTFIGEIVNINDPLRRNRVQVRIHGYENDKGLIPDDKLSWYSVLSTSSSQLAGSSSTHSYYPGAKVLLTMAGTEMIVMGTTAGFDSDKRRSGSSSGSSEQPDTPRQVQGKGKEQSGARDGEGKDTTTPTSRDPKTDKPYQEPDEQDAYKDSRDRAPFKKGEKAKKPDDKSIGNIKNTQGADILQMIKGMDGNASGAIKAGVDLIQKLRQSSYGTSQEMIGSGLMQQAASQAASDFSAPPLLNLTEIVRELLACWKIISGATSQSIKSLALDGSITRLADSLTPDVLQVSSSVPASIENWSNDLSVSNLPDNSAYLDRIRTEYLTGLNQAWAGITSYLNRTADQAGGAGGLIAMFRDPQAFCDLSSILANIGNSIGTSQSELASIGRSAVGTALAGGVQGAASASSSHGPAGQALSMIMNAFASNPIAQSEISGSINPQSLLKIPLKYAKKRENDPQKKFTEMFGQVSGALQQQIMSAGSSGSGSGSSGGGGGNTEPITYDYVTTATIGDYILPPATSSQATSGTGNNALMTPWSTAQAIAAAGGSSAGFQQRYLYTASAGQTTITGTDTYGLVLNYTPGYVEVVVNGIWLAPSDYTATSGSSITIDRSLNAGDEVYVYAISPFAAVNTYDKSQNGADIIDPDAFRKNIGVAEKNYILNGAMMVSQENGTASSSTSGYYPVDQFFAFNSFSGVLNAAQVTSTTPSGSPNRIRLTVGTADTSVAASDNGGIIQSIEGYRLADLLFGTASAQTVVLRFGVKAPAGTYCVAFRNNGNTRSYVAEYTISAGEANTDVVKSVVVPGDLAGTWLSNNGIGMQTAWCIMGGTTYQTTAGSWVSGNYISSPNQVNFMATVGNVFELFDVGLYEGSIAPDFHVPDFASELALCRRYFIPIAPSTFFGGGTLRTGGTAGYGFIPSTPMRVTPTISTSGLSTIGGDTIVAVSSIAISSYTGSGYLASPSMSTSGGGLGYGFVFYQQTGKNALNARM
jgi:hypothetical protein